MNFIRNFLQIKEPLLNENFTTQQEQNCSERDLNGCKQYETDNHDELSITEDSERNIEFVVQLKNTTNSDDVDPFVSNSKELKYKNPELNCESVLSDPSHEVLLPSKNNTENFDCQDPVSTYSVKKSEPVVLDNLNISSELISLYENNNKGSGSNYNATESKSDENISSHIETKPNCAFLEFSFDDPKTLKPPPLNLGKKGKHPHKRRGGNKSKATENFIDSGTATCGDSSFGKSQQKEPIVYNLNDTNNGIVVANSLNNCDINLLNLSGTENSSIVSDVHCSNESNNNNENVRKNFDFASEPSAQSTGVVKNIEITNSSEIENLCSFAGDDFSDSLIGKNKLQDTIKTSFPSDNIDNCSNISIENVLEIEFKVLESDSAVGNISKDNFDPSIDITNVVTESNFNSVDELKNDLNVEQIKENCTGLSISCFGNEEFAQLGDEANRLAAELTSSTEAILCEKSTMEEADISLGKTSSKSETFKNLNIDFDFDTDCGYKKDSRQTCETAMLSNKKKNESHILQLQVNQSEAGPEIATGLTSTDLKCASLFFKEAAELESQIRKNIAASSFNSDYASESSDSDPSNKAMLPGIPPNEERSAPEGTSSPDPRSHEDSEGHTRLQTTGEEDNVNELLKKQAMEFEEKLLRQGIVAAEKEKQLHEAMKGERNRLQKVTASRDALLKLVEQYKGMLAALVADKNKQSTSDDVTISSLEKEKQQAIEDLANVEAAFSDVHRKYERTKQIVDTLKRNEETLRNAVADYEDKLQKQEKKFIELQKHAEEKVKEANEEFENLRRSNDQEMIKMGALLKKAEMKIISLQDAFDRKSRENQELTQLCDDLISKVGS